MAKISIRGRLWLRAFHIFFMGLWIGAVIGQMIIMSLTGNARTDDGLRAMYVIPDILNLATGPGFFGTVITGVLLSWLTPWGFFKHKWVIYVIVVVVLDIIVAQVVAEPLIRKAASLVEAEGLNALQNPEYISAWNRYLLMGVIISPLMISAIFVSVLKPWRKGEKAAATT